MKTKDTIIKLAVLFSVIFGIRFIGIKHIPFIGIVAIYLFIIIYLIWSIIRAKKENIKDKYYIIFISNFIAFSMNIIIMTTIDNEYPKYSSVARPILITIFIILSISTTISIYAWAIASNKK